MPFKSEPVFCNSQTYNIHGGWRESVVKTGSVDEWDGRVDETVTNAFAAPIDSVTGAAVDFTDYHSTPHRLDWYSSGVLWASGFIGAAVPSGETLKADALAGWNFQTEGEWFIGAGTVTAPAVITADFSTIAASRLIFDAWGGSHKLTYDRTLTSGVGILRGSSASFAYATSSVTDVYRTCRGATTSWYMYCYDTEALATLTVNSMKCQRVLEPPATAALIFAADGERKWHYKLTAWNCNAKMDYKITKLSSGWA